MCERVRCERCGLLAIRNGKDSLVYPASETARVEGFAGASASFQTPGSHVISVPQPNRFICFLGMSEFVLEAEAFERTPKKVLEKDRKCDEYVSWTPGFSPKEHREMQVSQKMLDAQLRREEADRDWRAKQAAADREWRAAEAKRADERHRDDSRKTNNRFWLGFVFAIIVALLGQAASAWISRQWPASEKPIVLIGKPGEMIPDRSEAPKAP